MVGWQEVVLQWDWDNSSMLAHLPENSGEMLPCKPEAINKSGEHSTNDHRCTTSVISFPSQVIES